MAGSKDMKQEKTEKISSTGNGGVKLYSQRKFANKSFLPANVDRIRRFWLTPEVEEALRDHALAVYIAHVRMLGRTGILSNSLVEVLEAGLNQLLNECDDQICLLVSADADIHQAITRRLTEIVGDAAQAIDLARSENDHQVTNMRLLLREACGDFFAQILKLRQTLLVLASRDMEVPMPGYTHMQPATPILLSFYWLANEARLHRDFDRLIDLFKRLNLSPMGACSLAGTSKPIDREQVALDLSFDGVIENALDAVSDRDFVIDFASFASILGVHISQLSSELLLWTTQEFAFVRLPRELTYKSQNMPHKRNPELLELMRSRASTFAGRLGEFLGQLKGLPVSYTGDLREPLPGLVDMVENLRFVLELGITLLPAFKFDLNRMKEQATADLTNSSMALSYLLEHGLSTDKAREIVEGLGDYCKKRHKQLVDLTLSEWQQFSPVFTDEIYALLNIETSLESFTSFGGTATKQVSQAYERACERFEKDCQRLPALVKERIVMDFPLPALES
jgi:argininosuccinate lyase